MVRAIGKYCVMCDTIFRKFPFYKLLGCREHEWSPVHLKMEPGAHCSLEDDSFRTTEQIPRLPDCGDQPENTDDVMVPESGNVEELN